MSYFSQFGGAAPTKVTTYNSGSGNYTPISTNKSWARITLIGGGAGGTGPIGENGGTAGTGGGGGGSTLAFVKLNAATYAYSVGGGGNGGQIQGTGNAGGNTTFGDFYAGGGRGGTINENLPVTPNAGIGGSGTLPGGSGGGGMFSNSAAAESRLPLANTRIGGGSLYGYGQTNGAGVGGDGANSGSIFNTGQAGKAGLIYIEEFVQG